MAALAPLCPAAAQSDSVVVAAGDSLTFTTRYTLNIDNLQLITGSSRLTLFVCNASAKGTTLNISQDSIWDSNATLARGLGNDSKAHNYVLLRPGLSIMQLYRDGVLLCTLNETRYVGVSPVVRALPVGVANGYKITLASQSDYTKPVETDVENKLENMLPSTLTNLAPDPYCNHGFLCNGLNSKGRSFYSNAADFTGWGSCAAMDSENALSGPWCVKLWGAAVYSTDGASLDQNISFSSGTPYLIRAMVKSNGYTGKIAIGDEQDYIPVTDTQGEWKQIEGVITPTAARTLLYMNNSDNGSDASSNVEVYVDNFEVYAGYASLSSVPYKGGDVAAVQLKASETWSPTNPVTAYYIGFVDNGTTYSKIDTAKVKVAGATSLTKRVEGSRLYSLYFPGDLNNITVSGTYNGESVTDKPLVAGVDYLLQRYDYPRFEFMSGSQAVTSGCYIAQFVDNLDSKSITLNFSGTKSGAAQTGAYRFVGNGAFNNATPAGSYLKFNEDNMRFELAQGESLRPFEAYIETGENNPVQYIYTGYNTRLQSITADNGTRMSITSTRGALLVNATGEAQVAVYNMAGQLVKECTVSAGANTLPINGGLYLVNGKKVAVLP